MYKGEVYEVISSVPCQLGPFCFAGYTVLTHKTGRSRRRRKVRFPTDTAC